MSWLSGLTIDRRPLRHREVRLLLSARGISFFGSMITYVAVPFQVYAITHSTVAVGTIGIVELVAILLLAFVGGGLADARDRRGLVLRTEAVLFLAAALLVANASLRSPHLWPLYVLAATMGGLDALQRPALDALIARLAPPEEQSALSALISLEGTLAMVVAPAVAGVVIASSGVRWAYVIDASTFVVSLVLLRAMVAVPPPENADRMTVRSVLDGISYARSRPDLIGTYTVDFIAMIFGMPMALFPAIADRIGGPRTLGLLYAAPAFGSLLVALFSGWTGRIRRHGAAIAVAAAIWGFGIVVFGVTSTLAIALVGLVIAGAADMVSGLFRATMWNQTIPDRLRGRLASIEMLSYMSGPSLGNAEAGLAAAVIGVPAAIVSGGVLCIVGVAAITARLPAFWRYAAAAPEANAPAPATSRS